MPSPFPGMDPYLETPHLWPDVHHGLISQIRSQLNASLRPRYVARVELRVYISDDEEINEARVEIKHLETAAVVTVIEVLSPANKIQGARGRESFVTKRQEIFCTGIHWVEIDLLRGGVPSVTRANMPRSDYRILVSHAEKRSNVHCWPVELRQPLPIIGIPLRAPNADVLLDLPAVLRGAYADGAYDLSIDYREEPNPPLKGEDAAWVDCLLRQQKLR